MTPHPENTAEIKRYPQGMTGAKLRKQLGIEPPPEPTFKLSKNFANKPKPYRLKYLQRMEKRGAEIAREELWANRKQFNAVKRERYPVHPDTKCYCCRINKASARHHVMQLSRGGKNRQNNLVPLCDECHSKIHPHMTKNKTAKQVRKEMGPGSLSAITAIRAVKP